jgi:hypothetical protein
VIQASKTKVVDHAHNHYLPEKYLSRHMRTNAKTFGFVVIASAGEAIQSNSTDSYSYHHILDCFGSFDTLLVGQM